MRCHPGGIGRKHRYFESSDHERQPTDQTKGAKHAQPSSRRSEPTSTRYCGSCGVELYNRQRRHSSIGYRAPVQARMDITMTQAACNLNLQYVRGLAIWTAASFAMLMGMLCKARRCLSPRHTLKLSRAAACRLARI